MAFVLQQRFLDLLHRLGVPDEVSRELWMDLSTRYTEPHRHYHTLEHIGWMLDRWDETDVTNDAIDLAIWYHDAVYVPLAKDNEEASARLFRNHLTKYLRLSAKSLFAKNWFFPLGVQARFARNGMERLATIPRSVVTWSVTKPASLLPKRLATRNSASTFSRTSFWQTV